MERGSRSIWLRSVARLSVVLLSLTYPSTSEAQNCPQRLLGAWTGLLPARELVAVRIAVRERAAGSFEAEFHSSQATESLAVWREGTRLRFQSAALPIAFDGVLSEDGSRIDGFVQHASAIVRIVLLKETGTGEQVWAGEWSPLVFLSESLRVDLYIGDDGDGGIGAYFFFRDQRLPGLWGYGLECNGDVVRMGERNLRLSFEGELESEGSILSMTAVAAGGSAPMSFERMPPELVPSLPDAPEAPPRQAVNATYVEHAPESVDDGWPTSTPSEAGIDSELIGDMVRAIVDEELALTHSVLVVRRGKLVVEEYFYGFDRKTRHDMRSASKTVTSTLIGLAIQEGRIEDADAKALHFFPQYRRYANWDPRKAQISIRDLLTMSSGLDANDSDSRSVASEGAYQSQTERPDWIKLALDAPMVADPGSQPLYGGANPLILGGVLASVSDEPVEWFAHRVLFEPLRIEDYQFLLDPMGIVYMGGGLHMRPRDMAKYGQLYLDGGVWQGRRILSEDWVRESWGRYGRLAPLDRNGHQYGYLWWHHMYEVGGRTIETVEARGNGGQYIFVVPTLDLVVVITAGNFRTGQTRQPEEILRRYILPAVVD